MWLYASQKEVHQFDRPLHRSVQLELFIGVTFGFIVYREPPAPKPAVSSRGRHTKATRVYGLPTTRPFEQPPSLMAMGLLKRPARARASSALQTTYRFGAFSGDPVPGAHNMGGSSCCFKNPPRNLRKKTKKNCCLFVSLLFWREGPLFRGSPNPLLGWFAIVSKKPTVVGVHFNTQPQTHTDTQKHTHTHTQRERERERERDTPPHALERPFLSINKWIG